MLIEAINIHKIYPGPLHVLKGVDLTIEAGEVVAIVGPSGAGKSTLLHILGGLDAPKEGQVIFNGQDLYGLSDIKRAQTRNSEMGFVFQSYHLLPELTALENVILPAMIKENSRKTSAIEFAGLKLLEQLGLSSRASHRPNQLSGGEQQRVAIARALMNGPKVVFCDEPTGNLDSVSGQVVMDTLLRLNQTHGVTVVIVTHDEKIAARTQRTISMKDGLLEHPKEFSAGAIIYKKVKEQTLFLLIYSGRNKVWGFPKGHIEFGETEKDAALREIKEETGITDLRFIGEFREEDVYQKMSHREPSKGNFIEKHSVYFLCETKTEDIKVDFDEITNFKWLNIHEALSLLTFDRLKRILKKVEA